MKIASWKLVKTEDLKISIKNKEENEDHVVCREPQSKMKSDWHEWVHNSISSDTMLCYQTQLTSLIHSKEF